MNKKYIAVPGRLESIASDGQIAGARQVYDDVLGKNQQDINAELKDLAESEAAQAKYYNELTQKAIESLTINEQEVLKYTQAVVKHGRAIQEIAVQLGASYNEEGRDDGDEYIPGYKFNLTEEEDMEILLADPSQAEEGMIYMQMEPLEDEEG